MTASQPAASTQSTSTAGGATRRNGAGRRRVPFPRSWGLRASDAYAIVAVNAVLILVMWIRHGNLRELHTLGGTITAAGELAALYGTYLALIQVVLASRSPYLDEVFGTDRLLRIHHWTGFAVLWLLLGHFVFTTVGYGMLYGLGPVDQAVAFLVSYPYVWWSFIAMGLFVAVAIASLRLVRRRLAYETWFGIHLYVYLAIALAFMHELVVGTDFIYDPVARAYWIGLYVLAFGSIAIWRFGWPLYVSLRHGLRVANVVEEAPGVTSVYLTGRDLDRLATRAGQWFLFRFLTRDDWWRARPFSLSAAPNGRYLRVTMKIRGRDTARLRHLRIGTRVFVEGPYGIFTGARRSKNRVLLIAGGIGITPVRALVEELPAAPGRLTLVYRVRRAEDLAFRRELDTLASMRGITVHYLVGRRGSRDVPREPFGVRSLQALVPDIDSRDVYVCGPESMAETVTRSLRALRVPPAQIHVERFAH